MTSPLVRFSDPVSIVSGVIALGSRTPAVIMSSSGSSGGGDEILAQKGISGTGRTTAAGLTAGKNWELDATEMATAGSELEQSLFGTTYGWVQLNVDDRTAE